MQKVFEEKRTLLRIQWVPLISSVFICTMQIWVHGWFHVNSQKKKQLHVSLNFLISKEKKKTERCEKHEHKWKCSHSLWLVARRVVASTPQFLVERLPGTVTQNSDAAELHYAYCVKMTLCSYEPVRLHRENMLLSALDDVLPVNMQVTRLAAESSCSVSDPQNVIRSVWLWSVGVWC